MSVSLTDIESSLKNFDDVRDDVAGRHALRIPDRVVELKTVTVTDNLHIRVPHFGILEMTPWAKTQIGNCLGIKWDKWFATKHLGHVITAREIQEELSRRFNRLPGMERLVRARRHQETTARSDGTLEAFLGPKYEPIDDERIFSRLDLKFAHSVHDLRILQRMYGSLPYRSWGWGTDRSSHYLFLVGEEVQVGSLADGTPDNYVAGFYLRNSEVGHSSLTIDDFWLRLSGMTGFMPHYRTNKDRLLYRQHRHIEDDDIDELLKSALSRMETRHGSTLDALIESKQEGLDREPTEIIESWLQARGAPARFIENAKESWEEEPTRSRFAVMQAISRAASLARDPDKRFEYEHMAGRFLLKW